MKRISPLLLTVLMLAQLQLHGQQYQVRLTGFEQLSEYEFGFLLQLRNPSPDAATTGAWAYNSGQYQICLDEGMLNGGQFMSVFMEVDATVSQLPEGQQLTGDDFFFSRHHGALALNSPCMQWGSQLLLLDHNRWVTLSGFRVKLRDASGDGFLNLASVWPGGFFRLENTRVFAAPYCLDDAGAARRSPSAGVRELQKTAHCLWLEPADVPLAGFWFYGSGPWHDAARWNQALLQASGGYLQQLPGPGQNVVIHGMALISRGHDVVLGQGAGGQGGMLRVAPEEDAGLIIGPGASLSVDWLESPRTAGVVMQSGGSLIQGRGRAAARVERLVAVQGLPNAEAWQLLAPPVAGQPLEAWAAGARRLLTWDAPGGAWCSYPDQPEWQAIHPRGELIAGRGYLGSFGAGQLLAFEGWLVAGDLACNWQPTTFSEGWLLPGNPFAAALSWDHPAWQLHNLCHSAWLWDAAAGSYRVISPGRGEVIPAGEAFFVHVVRGDRQAGLLLPAAARVHHHLLDPPQPVPRLQLLAFDPATGFSQPLVIASGLQAAQGFDPRYDAPFLQGFAPAFYSLKQGRALAVNTLPELVPGMQLSLGFTGQGRGWYSISLQQALPGLAVTLVDHALHSSQLLDINKPYHFSWQPGEDTQRFELLLGEEASHSPGQPPQATLLVLQGNTLYARGSAASHGGLLQVFDTGGRLLLQQSLPPGQQHQLPLGNMAPGIVVMQLIGPRGVIRGKGMVF